MKIEIYTDGSCSINNVSEIDREGDGGYGFCVIRDGELIYEYFDMWHNTTNNRMEMRAIIQAVEYCWNNCKDADITIYSDSAYIVNCLKQKWYKKWMVNGWKNSKREPVKNPDLWKEMLHAHMNWITSGKINVEKVPGHKDVKWNNYADTLANKWRAGASENFSIDKK
jgi:ribonuclease HI